MSDARNMMVVIDGANYAVTELPAADSGLVRQARDTILGGLKLHEMLPELHRSRALLDLARAGVGADLTLHLNAPITKIQDELGAACRHANRVIGDISTTVGTLLDQLRFAFGHLFAGRETIAVGLLSKCSEAALAMADASSELADRFHTLGDNTANVLSEVQEKQSVRAEIREKLRKDREELETRTAATQRKLTELATAKADLEEQYKQAKEEAEKHEGRAFGLAIVGAIFTPLAQGLGAFAGSTSGAGAARNAAGAAAGAAAARPRSPRPPELPKKPAPKTGTADPKAVKAADPKGTDPKATDAKATDAKSPDPKAADRKAAGAKDGAANPVNDDKPIGNGATSPTGNAQGGAQGAADGAQGVADGANDAAGGYQQIADNYHKQKMFFLQKLQEAKKDERDAMAAVVEFAERMKNLKEEAEVNRCVLESLHQAVGALQRVVLVLRQTEDFWRRMALSFQRLAKDDLKAKINLYRAEISDANERSALYLEDDFKREFLGYLAGWRAVQVVTAEYAAAVMGIAEGIAEDYTKNLTEAENRAAIPQLAQQVLANAGPTLKALDAEARELQDEVLALPKAA